MLKLESYDLHNEDLCDPADIEVDGESIIGVNDDLITMEVSHPKFRTDLHPLVVGLQYSGWSPGSLALHCSNQTPPSPLPWLYLLYSILYIIHICILCLGAKHM